jgi:YHS domain-containing protein
MLIRLLIYGLLVWGIYRIVQSRRHPDGAAARRDGAQAPGPVDDVMVQDPVCGAYFPRSQAVRADGQGETPLFCSPECRDRYLDGRT